MKLCFVIMPIGSGDAYDVYLNRYTNIIKPAVKDYQQDGARIFGLFRESNGCIHCPRVTPFEI